MDTRSSHKNFLSSQQSHFVFDWLAINRIKRGSLLFLSVLFTMSAAIIRIVGTVAQTPQSKLLMLVLLSFSVLQFILALAVIIAPVRRLLLITAIIEGCAFLLWLIAHTAGLPPNLPGNVTLWKPEILGLPDFYLPVMEGVSALFFLCLSGRTLNSIPASLRFVLRILPALVLLVGLLILGVTFAVDTYAAELVFATFIFIAGFPTSLFVLVLPITGLFAAFLFLRLISTQLRVRTPGAWRTTLVLLPALLLMSLVTWAGSSTAASRGWFPLSLTVHASAGQTTTVSYCNDGNTPLAMDISEPTTQWSRPAPVVFYIHGGAGFQNSRKLATDFDSSYFMRLRDELLNHGFVVGSIDYPLIPLASGQEMVKDAKCAVRFLRAHANEIGINSQRIGVYGDSEGGYMAAMLGTVGPNAGFDTGQYMNQSSSVQAVVDLWGFTDLTNFSGSPGWVHPFGEGEPVAQQRANSPITYVAPGDPPFLIIHGTDDGLIAPHHSLELAKLLRAANVPTQLVQVQHGGHGFNTPAPGTSQQPTPNALVAIISEFFVKTLAV